MKEFTPGHAMLLSDFLSNHSLAQGLGTADRPCSMGAINLILNGEVTDDIPDCMSEVIGRFIIQMQDRMPVLLRNSSDWKNLLPLAARTRREKDLLRRDMLMDWMWGVLARIQYVADSNDFGSQWATMLKERTWESAFNAAEAVGSHTCGTPLWQARVTATHAADAVHYSYPPMAAVISATKADYNHSTWDFWFAIVNPCKILEEMIEV
jgi:hypothetical protein